MKKIVLYSVMVFIAILFPISSFADVPRIISYQGVLTDASGKPIVGKKNITFQLKEKNGALANSWTETIPDIELNGGLFSVPLGLTSVPVGFPILNGEYDIIVSLDGKSFQIPIYSAVHALSIADNCVTSSKIKDGEVTYPKLAPATEGDILQYSDNQWKTIPMPQGVPVGIIVAFYGNSSQIPDGWLLCDGSTVMASYPLLQQHLITLNGTATLPDLRGQFLRGLGGVDPDAATRTIGSVQTDIFTSHNHGGGVHNHSLHDPGHSHRAVTQHGGDKCEGGNDRPLSWDLGATTASAVTGIYMDNSSNIISTDGGSETRPKNVAVNYIIKAK